MATDVIMPQMGESIAEGTITKWIKNVGDSVSRDEPLFEISTDKVDAEIPAPAAGTLVEILVQPGQTVGVNTVVGRIGEAGARPAAPAPAPAPAPTSEAPKSPAPPPAPTPTPEAPKVSPPAPPPPSTSAVRSTPPPSVRPAEPSQPSSFEERIRSRSSPLVRRIASENEVAIGEVEGTGIAGRVTKNDILSFIDNRKAAPRPRSAPEAAAPAAPSAGSRRAARDEAVPMSVMRRKIAERMVESRRTSAHVATVFSIDYSAIDGVRRSNKDSFLAANGVKLTFLPFIFQAVTAALKKFPDLNASIDGEEIVYHHDVHLGMAVALDWGLIVPVIKNADEKSILGLARASQDLAERARSKKLKPEEVSGGTFTITNPGVYGSLFGTPIIVQPQVAILGVGAIEKRPVVVTDSAGNDSIGVRTTGYLALSFDHRLIDGAVADQFMAEVKKTLEAGSFSLS
ncbi:MAG: 2-oxoglutarate dehydrogenase, E2 component, dihydrolipoamide succinyltransferase [Thermoanaerobaculia bacterium]